MLAPKVVAGAAVPNVVDGAGAPNALPAGAADPNNLLGAGADAPNNPSLGAGAGDFTIVLSNFVFCVM